jgi:ABC-type branched-subunit amino acid transport system substrate-binding protein
VVATKTSLDNRGTLRRMGRASLARRAQRPSGRGSALLLTVGLLAACGSTVQDAALSTAGGNALGGTVPGGAAGDGLTLGPRTGGETTDGLPTGAPDGVVSGSSSSAPPGTAAGNAVTTTGAPGATTPGAAGGGPVRLGPGVSAKEVRVGMVYAPDLNDAQKAAGSDNLTTGNPRAQEEALIEEINRRGGVAGRKLVLDAYPISATTPNVEQAYNGACAHFTQDSKVFAVLTAGPASFGACLEKGGVLHIGSDLTASSRATTAAQPHGYRPAGIAMEDSAELLVSGLDQLGWFKDSVVGVITFDAPVYQDTVKKVMLPALERIGHPSKEEFYATTPQSLSDYGAMSSSISSAVLRFRQAGVTHLIIFDQQGRITTFFVPAAENQGYRPKYGFTSQAGFQVGVSGGSIPPEQARGAAGIGWLPAFDVPLAEAPASAGARRCKDFFTSRSMPPSNENSTVIQQFQCQDAWLLDTVMDRLTGDVTREAFRSLLDTGTSQVTAANHVIGFTPRSHDGVRAVRNLSWEESCGCFRYRGGNRPLG